MPIFGRTLPLRAPCRRALRGAGALLAAAAGWVVPATATELPPASPRSEYLVASWGPEAGLPAGAVTALAAGGDGFLWFVAGAKLGRFDGHEATVLPVAGTVAELAVDGGGTVWARTERGAVGRPEGREFRPEPGVAQARWLAAGPDGRMWVQTADGELRWRGPEGWRAAEPAVRVPPEYRVRGWSPEGDLLVAAATTNGRWRAGAFEPLHGPQGRELPDYPAAPARAGGMWLFTVNAVGRRLGDRWVQWLTSEFAFGESRQFVAEDRAGYVWVGYQRGLKRLGPGRAALEFTEADGLRGGVPRSFCQDGDGNRWIGLDGALVRLKPRVVRMLDREDGMTVDAAMSVAQTADGAVWFGLRGGGLNRLRGGAIAGDDLGGALRPRGWVWPVVAEPGGGLWAATRLEGLAHAQAGSVRKFGAADGVPPGYPTVLLTDRRGRLWVGTSEGLARREQERFRRFGRESGLGTGRVTALAELADGRMAVGTTDGLRVAEGGKFEPLVADLPAGGVRALRADADGALWIGTATGGLWRWQAGNVARFGPDEGLPARSVTAIETDLPGRLWLATERGLFAADRAALVARAEGRGPAVGWMNLGLADGLATLEFAAESQPAVLRDRDGRLWFGTTRGVAVVEADRVPRSPDPPPVRIEQAVADGERRDVAAGQALTLPAGVQRIRFRLAALSLTMPEKVRFRAKLEGDGAEWMELGAQREVSFVGLPPGDYVLQAGAAHGDGAWGEPGARLAFTLRSAWWQTGWFRFAVAGAAVGLLAAGYRRRMRAVATERAREREFTRRLLDLQERERQRIAGELHDSLGQNLLVIRNRATLGRQAAGDPVRVGAELAEIGAASTQALEEVRAIAHALRPAALDRLGLTRALRQLAEQTAESGGLRLEAEVADCDGRLGSGTEIHVFRLLQEALNNAVKHAAAATLAVRIAAGPAAVTVEVEDDGRGFVPAEVEERAGTGPGGNGLPGMRERARLIGAELVIDTAPGRGTRWRLTVPARSLPS